MQDDFTPPDVLPSMTEAVLISRLMAILDGFLGVPVGQVSAMGLLFALQDLGEFIGGEVQTLLQQIDVAYCALAYPAAGQEEEP